MEHAEHAGLLADTYVWITLSFLIFCAAAFVFGRKSVTGGLDARINAIRAELDEAAKAHNEAMALLAEYQQRANDAEAESARIIRQAKEDAQALKEKAIADLEADLIRKEEWLSGRLTRMQEDAQTALQSHAATIVLQSAEQIVAQAVTEKAHDALVAETIKTLPSLAKKAA
jgi:F-type H+-transporting ATPase subunit b